jgi:Tfp pilus assembly protein PilF
MTNRRWALVLAGTLWLAGCASVPRSTGPAHPDFQIPDVPARLAAPADVRQVHLQAWQRFQSGDARGANSAFSEILKRSPGFYPAETALGFIALAGRQYKAASARFGGALARDGAYVPALDGMAAAQIGLDDLAGAIVTLERLVALVPREEYRTRLDLVRLKQVQRLTGSARRARDAGRHAEAKEALARALAISPDSPAILRELALVELASGSQAEADAHLRRAIQLDPNDAESHVSLAAVLEARGRVNEAASEYGRAAAIDPKWRSKAEAARAAAERIGVPDELLGLEDAATVNRGQLAALIGTRLASILSHAQKRAPTVATDIRSHWAAEWIVTVMQAGVMDAFSNHTFQPASVVSRADLAQVIGKLVTLALVTRVDERARLQAARPALADLPQTNAAYRSAAVAIAAGAMKADESGRFQPARPATGAEVLAAINRVDQLGAR